MKYYIEYKEFNKLYSSIGDLDISENAKDVLTRYYRNVINGTLYKEHVNTSLSHFIELEKLYEGFGFKTESVIDIFELFSTNCVRAFVYLEDLIEYGYLDDN